MKILVKVMAVLLFWMALGSCFKDSECIDLRNDIIGIAFKENESGKTDALTITNILISESQYVFSENSSTIDKVSLPLNPAKNLQQIEFILSEPPGTVSRTIEIAYHVKTQFESTDCEPKFLFSNLTVINHDFLSVKIVNTVPYKGGGVVNIEIAYR